MWLKNRDNNTLSSLNLYKPIEIPNVQPFLNVPEPLFPHLKFVELFNLLQNVTMEIK